MNKGWKTGLRLALVAMIAALAVGTAGVAGAQDVTDPYVGPSPTVENETIVQDPPAEVQAQQTVQDPPAEVQGSNLAFTGGDIVVLVTFGLAALIAGALVLASRRRTVATA